MFVLKKKNDINYFISDKLDIAHAFTTKGWDMRSSSGIDKVCQKLCFDSKNLIIPKQEHTNNIALIRTEDDLNKNLSATDGVIISIPNIPVMLVFADCTPVMIYSKEKQVLALLHAGWKGTAMGIVSLAVKMMQDEFGVAPQELNALVGAAIGDCCYEISDDVSIKLRGSLKGDYDDIIVNNMADLKKINEYQLKETGIVDIDMMDYCTSCDNELFYSYRKNFKTTKRHAMLAQL